MTTELQIEVGQLRNTQERTAIILESISQNIGAISDVEKSLSKIIAVHEEKFRHQEKTNEEFSKALEKASVESREMYKESKREFTVFRDEVLQAITSLRIDTLKSAEKTDTKHTDKIEKLEERIAVLERWRYYIIGVVAVSSWAINHIINWYGAR